ncbi:transcriptional regulator [Parabacteroides goldsteinii]|nr:helix-turn-helix domain-containing protein [Parabacteroides goldsteinii]GKG71392.1 transcriptional regulator [Parabacteroides goldsteinii]GKG77345.1 transcriptional regulator [Parabacteroides goldsteinii]
MKHRFYTYLIILFAFYPVYTLQAIPSAQPEEYIPDSLLTVQAIRNAALSDPDRALLLLDEAEKRESFPQYQIDWTRAQIYGGPKRMERMAAKWGKRVLENDSVLNNPQYYFNMCKNLIESMIATRDYEEAMKYARSMIDVIERSSNSTSNHHNAYWAIARVYRAMGNPGEAYTYMNEAIRFCREQIDIKRKREHPIVSDELKLLLYKQNLADWQQEDGRTADALKTTLSMQEEIERLRPLKGGAFPHKIPDASFQAKEGIIAGKLACLYVQAGQAGKGREWFEKLQENPLAGRNPDLVRLEIEYYKHTHEYGKLVGKAYRLADPVAYDDSIHEQRKEACLLLADAYRHLGKEGEANAFYETALLLADSLKRRDNENNALEMATLLETREKERQIEQQAEELKWHRTLTTVAGGILFLICVIFLLVVRHSRIVGRKNKLMAQQIELYLSYRTKLDTAQLRINQLEEMLAEQTKVNTDSKEEKEEKSTATLGDINEADRRSFEELDLKIRNERLFLDPNFSRDILLQLTPVGKNRISSLLQTFTGENFNGYINSLRLEYSLSLLKKFNHYTIEAIAMDSGFNNVRTYQRLFRDKYGMTPAEYKKSLQAER